MPRGVEKVPQVMQMEALECGDACLAMILAYYGRWEPLEKVREQCGVSRATVGFYSQRMVGDLQQRQSSNESITFALIGQIAPIIVNVIMLLLYLFVMLRYSVLLTAVGVATVIIKHFSGTLCLDEARKRIAFGDGKCGQEVLYGRERHRDD